MYLALRGNKIYHAQLLDLVKSDQFCAREVKQTMWVHYINTPPSEHPFTHILYWCILRKVKLSCIEVHDLCCHVALEKHLQSSGEHVRHIYSQIFDGSRTQNLLVEKYCRNLTAYVLETDREFDGLILRILNNNKRLEKLHIIGSLLGADNPSENLVTLPKLKQLKWIIPYELRFGASLAALAKAAPNLQQLSISRKPFRLVDSNGDLFVDVARASLQLRTFSCKELHLGPKDNFLKPFLETCNKIVNLDLHLHYELTDTVLIDALSELKCIRSLNLQGCCHLTDRTLEFLCQRFSSTLQVLFLDHSVFPYYCFRNQTDAEGNPVVHEEALGYTAAGVFSLRERCTKLRTFEYIVQAGAIAKALYTEAYKSATIVQVSASWKEVSPSILEHCDQMHTLVMTYDQYNRVCRLLSAEQLMTVAARFPKLSVVGRDTLRIEGKDNEVDYSAVKKAFSKLHFAEDLLLGDYNAFDMPI